MKLTVGEFGYLGIILEGFLVGEISVLQQPRVSFSKDPFQESIPAYLVCICNVMHPEKRSMMQNKRLFSMLSVSYMCCLWLSLLLILEILWLSHL